MTVIVLQLLVVACRGVLLIGFVRHSEPVICKFTAKDEDVVRESQVLSVLWQQPAVKGVVGPVELVTVRSNQQVRGQVPALGGQSITHLERIHAHL